MREQVGWWPWALVVLMTFGTAASNRDADPPWPVVVGVLLAVTACLPAVLRLDDRLSLVASGALVGGYFAAGYADGPAFLALPAVTFVVASGTRMGGWVWAAAMSGLLALGGLIGREWWTDMAQAPVEWQGAGLVAVTAAAGAIATARRARGESARANTQRTATEERLRMAQDLHDGVGHGLAVIAMQAGVGLHVLDKDPARVREHLEAIRTTSREALDALRAELALMSGDPAARRPTLGVDDLDALLERVRSGGLTVELSGTAGEVSEAVGRVVYAVVQESLTNVLRHAGAAHATVALDRRVDALVVVVRDDGRGSTGAAGATGGEDVGMGITGMRRRVESLGGRLAAGALPVGFEVRAEIPVDGGVG